MDWRIYKAIYDVSLQHHWVGSLFNGIEKASIPFMVVVTVALWLLARPGGSRKWKVAATSGLAAAALALIANRVIASIWHRDRPFQDHAIRHPWSSSHDASFPSDHASASFAIAVAILLIDPLAGALFLVLALLISVGRVVVGEHYPGDVVAGAAIGTVCALIVVRLARPVIVFLVRLVERITDPVLAPIWRRVRGVPA
jgi:undecaprenyl-diphosphatase